MRRFRIQKCCSLCGHWELRDRTRPPGRQIIRLADQPSCVHRMTAILAIEDLHRRHEELRP